MDSLITDSAEKQVETFGIGYVVSVLNQGGRVARQGWNGKGMWLMLQRPDDYSKMSRPYVYMRTADGGLVPWVCSQSDLLATDWYRVVTTF